MEMKNNRLEIKDLNLKDTKSFQNRIAWSVIFARGHLQASVDVRKSLKVGVYRDPSSILSWSPRVSCNPNLTHRFQFCKTDYWEISNNTTLIVVCVINDWFVLRDVVRRRSTQPQLVCVNLGLDDIWKKQKRGGQRWMILTSFLIHEDNMTPSIRKRTSRSAIFWRKLDLRMIRSRDMKLWSFISTVQIVATPSPVIENRARWTS